ncbi:MAG: hypothetical protein WBC93_16435 [Sulfitobacter sp.]
MNPLISPNSYLAQPALAIDADIRNFRESAPVLPVGSGSDSRGAGSAASDERQNGSAASVLLAKARNIPDATSKSVVEAQASNGAKSAIAFLNETAAASDQDAALETPVGFRDLDLPNPTPTADVLLLRS